MKKKRSYLFLQGPRSPFFPRLADELKAQGHSVFKINFTAGDLLYWSGRSCWNYRGPIDELSTFLTKQYEKLGITDQVLFGDQRPVHRPAIEFGKKHNVRTHVFEGGYFRPHWITLEREGVNAHSLLPRDPAWFLSIKHRLPPAPIVEPLNSPFRTHVAYYLAYHFASFWNPLLFPRYKPYGLNAAIECFGYARRLPLLRFHKERDRALIEALITNRTPFFFVPLQINYDAQIRYHSSFKDMQEVLELILLSFAHHAPKEMQIVIKNHPLDLGLMNYSKIIHKLENIFDLKGRIHYMETGDLKSLLLHAKGTVTVNSTVGMQALDFNCPTMTLSNPIYNLPGLTFQGKLEDFWKEPHQPDRNLFDAFRQTVFHATQVNGGFFCRKGIALAVEKGAQILEKEHSPLEELL